MKEAVLQIGWPSVEWPFGVHLWPIFDEAFQAVVGYPAHEFQYVRGKTPLSTTLEVAVGIAAYYVIILGGRLLMKKFSPLKLNLLFQLHNVMLTTISLVLLLLFIEQLSPIIINEGLFSAICANESWTQHLLVLYYLNYLTKYVELLDTVFLFLKKKPLTFLHCYHHGATALLCYTQLNGHTSVSWVVITLNLTVHIIMYWYYFLSARGIRVWWKEWVTRVQIIQFVIDLGFVYFASYTYFSWKYFPYMPNCGSCAGEEFAAIYGCALLTSYLFLFLAFYANVYRKKGRRAANRKVSDGNIAIDPKFTQDALEAMNARNGNGGAITPAKELGGPPSEGTRSSARTTAPTVRSRKA